MAIKNTNNIEMKKINRNRIFKLIYQSGKLSKQTIAYRLNISLPTVTQNLKSLQEQDLIVKTGMFESTGGRKAKAISCNNMARLAIGIDITKNHVVALTVDMSGNIIRNIRERISFENAQAYFETIGKQIEKLTEAIDDKSKILGVGISVPGLLSDDGRLVTYATALGFTGGRLSNFEKYIPYPCILSNDAGAAGIAELWNSELIGNVVYLSLSSSVGGAILLDKKFYPGDNCRSGEFGHIKIVPDGKLCYCGQKGCVDPYINANVLSGFTNGNLSSFFENLKNGDMIYNERWNNYLHYLSLIVNNLRMTFDCSVILGGYVGSYMDNYISELQNIVSRMNSFEPNGQYVKVCKYKMDASAVGAALLHIQPFIDNI